MSSTSNGNGKDLPEPASVGDASQSNEPAAVRPSAMNLFAPDPNADPESVS